MMTPDVTQMMSPAPGICSGPSDLAAHTSPEPHSTPAPTAAGKELLCSWETLLTKAVTCWNGGILSPQTEREEGGESGGHGSISSAGQISEHRTRWARSCSPPWQHSRALLLSCSINLSWSLFLPSSNSIFYPFHILYTFTLYIYGYIKLQSANIFSFLSGGCQILFPSLNSKTEKPFRYKIQTKLLNETKNETKKLKCFICIPIKYMFQPNQ